MVVFHSTAQLPPGILKRVAFTGALGVQVFFVISGFILPFSLDRAGYTISSFFRFLARRIMRLDPPYFASLAVTIALFYASGFVPGMSGIPFHLSAARLALHVGYLTQLAGYEWYNVVYWTLAIELQFYLLIGLLFPLIASRKRVIAIATLLALGASAALIRNESLIFYWILPFLLGMIAFRLKTRRIEILEYVLLTVPLAGALYYLLGPGALIAAVATTLVISFLTIKGNRVLQFLGAISYSLYLIHVPIAGRVVNLGQRLAPGFAGQVLISLAAVGAAVLGGWVLYVLVERPAQRWAATMPLKSGTPRGDVTELVEAILPSGG